MISPLVKQNIIKSTPTKKTFFDSKKKVKSLRQITPTTEQDHTQKTKPKTSTRRGKKEELKKLKPTVRKIKRSSSKLQHHETTEHIVNVTKAASILPSEDVNKSIAQGNQVKLISEAEKKEFDKEGFKVKLKTSIYDTIRSKNEAKNLNKNNTINTVSEKIKSDVDSKKEDAGGAIETASKQPPKIDKKNKTSNPNDLVLQKISSRETLAKQSVLAPKKRPNADSDLSKESAALDEELAFNNITEQQLSKGNEPQFINTLATKKTAQTKADKFPKEYKAEEASKINHTQNNGKATVAKILAKMFGVQSKIKGGTGSKQKEQQNKELKVRLKVKTDIDNIYTETNNNIKGFFLAIDTYISEVFNVSLQDNLTKFSSEVASLIDDNDGWEWGLKVITFSDVQSEAEIFNIAKEHFIFNMTAPINNLVTEVESNLNQAEKASKDGKTKLDSYWTTLSTEDLKITADLKIDVDKKFKLLDESIAEKEDAVVDTVTEKFSTALDELDTRFEKALEESKSWLSRAYDSVKGAINTIIELKNTIKKLATKAAKYADRIIDDPIEFFGNLADGVGLGFRNFKKNIDKHLIKGVLTWLTGSMGNMGIIMPDVFDFKGIVSLILQILGITMLKVKKIIISKIGKKRFEFIEKGVEKGVSAGNKILNIFRILKEKGIAGLWEFIKEEFGNLKKILIDTVKGFIIDAITKKAIEILLSLLIPGAGFIRAAQLLIRFVVTLFQKAGEIIQIIDGIIDSFGEILDKNISKAAQKVENVLGGFISLAISFLAAVLGLNGIAKKIQNFIKKKILPKINKALHKIGDKVKLAADKIGLTKLVDKSMKKVEQGKAWAESKKESAKKSIKKHGLKVLQWLGITKRFKLGNESHSLLFKDKGGHPEFTVQSSPTRYQTYINAVSFEDSFSKNKPLSNKYGGESPKEAAINAGKKVDTMLSQYKKTNEKDRKQWGKDITGHLNNISVILSKYAIIGGDLEEDVPSMVFWASPNSKGHGKSVNVKQLSAKYIKGDETGDSGTDKGLSSSWDTIQQNKGKYKSYYYVRGHLLNAKVGGLVNNTNLTPLSRNANKNHHKEVEKDVKKIVTGKARVNAKAGKKSIIRYKVEAIYGQHSKRDIKLNTLSAEGEKVKKMEETTGVIPTKINYTLSKLKIDNNKVVKDESVASINGSIKNDLPEKIKLKKE